MRMAAKTVDRCTHFVLGANRIPVYDYKPDEAKRALLNSLLPLEPQFQVPVIKPAPENE
jgi:hypothetical protein